MPQSDRARLRGRRFSRASCESAGASLDGARVCEVAPMVGMVFQDFEAQLFSTNVAHEVAFAMEQVGMARAEMARAHRSRARSGRTRRLRSIAIRRRSPAAKSSGSRSRRCSRCGPSVIVLDEPTSDLDPEGKAEVFALIRRLREPGSEPDRDRARGRGTARLRSHRAAARGRDYRATGRPPR